MAKKDIMNSTTNNTATTGVIPTVTPVDTESADYKTYLNNSPELRLDELNGLDPKNWKGGIAPADSYYHKIVLSGGDINDYPELRELYDEDNNVPQTPQEQLKTKQNARQQVANRIAHSTDNKEIESAVVERNALDKDIAGLNSQINAASTQDTETAPAPAPADNTAQVNQKRAVQGEQIATEASLEAATAQQNADKIKKDGEAKIIATTNDPNLTDEEKIGVLGEVNAQTDAAQETANEAQKAADDLREEQTRGVNELKETLTERQQDKLDKKIRERSAAVNRADAQANNTLEAQRYKAARAFLDAGWKQAVDKTNAVVFVKDGEIKRLVDVDNAVNFPTGVWRNGIFYSPNDPNEGADDREEINRMESDKAVLKDLRAFMMKNNGVLSTDNLKTWLNFEGGGERMAAAIRGLGGSQFEQAIARTGLLTPRMKRRLQNFLIEEDRQQSEAKSAMEKMIGEATKPKEKDDDVTLVDKDGNKTTGNKEDYNNILNFSKWVSGEFSPTPNAITPERTKLYQTRYKELWDSLSDDFKKRHPSISPEGMHIDSNNGEQTLSGMARLFEAYAEECPDYGNAMSAMGYELDKDGIPTFNQNLVDDIYKDDDTNFDIEFERRRALRNKKNIAFNNILGVLTDNIKAEGGAKVMDNKESQEKKSESIENRYQKALEEFHKNQEQLRKDKIDAAKTAVQNALDITKLDMNVFKMNKDVDLAYKDYQHKLETLREAIRHNRASEEISKAKVAVERAELAFKSQYYNAQANNLNAQANYYNRGGGPTPPFSPVTTNSTSGGGDINGVTPEQIAQYKKAFPNKTAGKTDAEIAAMMQ
ncbi:MAG: hypothetical protein J6034_01355 [Bacteroidaceae bacterium]|nr:hypothetical protein [Bacteroidaceae bacterium]